jgi:hypothetical protein
MMPIDYSLMPPDEEMPSPGLVLKKARAKASAGGTLSNSVTPPSASVLPNSIAAMRGRAAELYQQGNEMFNAEPDTTDLQDFARKRGEQGSSAMLNALAAQFAGEQFQPVQEQLLKKAQIATEPIKVGSGLITSEGKYIKDPFAAQDKRAEFLMQQARMYEQLATNAETRAEQQAYRQQQDAVMNEIRAMNAQTARIAAGNTQNNRNFSVEDRMADDYDKAIKNDKIIVNAFENLKSTPQSAAGDISFIYQYMKMLDPGSVVREGEFATAQNAAGVPDRILNVYNRALRGERLNPKQRQDFLGTAAELANVAGRRMEGVRTDMTSKAQRRGVNIDNIIGSGGGANADPLNLRR